VTRMTPRRAGTLAVLLALGLGPILAGAGSSAGAAPQPSPIPDNALVTSSLEDDFNGPAGSAPNSSLWNVQTTGGIFKHGSLANYTTSPDNVSLDGRGHLHITVRKDTSSGSPVYTSGFVASKSLVGPDMHIGARIKIAKGYGMWPLFWIEGVNSQGVGWPATGEIDIMENPAKLPREQWATAHGLAVSGGNYAGHWKSTTVLTTPWKLSDGYHTYALDVTPDTLTWSFDGRPYKVLHKSDLQPTWEWSFNMPFVIMLNVDVGGPFPGNPKPTTKFPTTMSIDYVKVVSN
jgi:beta-glucanase (GH16 family)